MYKVNTQQINRQLFTIIQRSSISCKLDIENCPEVEIHSNKDLRNGKCIEFLHLMNPLYISCLYFVLPSQTSFTRFSVPYACQLNI